MQVIVALQEKSQGKMHSHIPYRNSMVTFVLRDSIGGNCRTVNFTQVSNWRQYGILTYIHIILNIKLG